MTVSTEHTEHYLGEIEARQEYRADEDRALLIDDVRHLVSITRELLHERDSLQAGDRP